MAYAFVSSTFSGGNTLASFVINAGESLIISAHDPGQINASLTITDGTNTYAVRGTKNDTRDATTETLIDCLAPTPGTYTLTLSGTLVSGWFVVTKYTGLASYSASSFAAQAYPTATPPTTTDGCTTTAITPSAYPAMIFGSGTCFGTLAAGTGFTLRASLTSGPEFFIEDLRLASSGSNIVSFTMTVGGSDVVVLGAAYLEPGGPVVPSSYPLESNEYF